MNNSANRAFRSLRVIELFFLLLMLILPLSAFGQNATGTILGTVRDANGAVMPNVAVIVTNEQTGQAFNVTTDGLGNYAMPLLKPGRYAVSAEANGSSAIGRAVSSFKWIKQLAWTLPSPWAMSHRRSRSPVNLRCCKRRTLRPGL